MQRVRNIYLLGVCFALLFCSCNDNKPLQPGDYSLVSIAYLKSEYWGYVNKIFWPWSVRGTVTSSDEYGNFYKSLIIEDTTAAIELRLNHTQLHTDFPPGCQVEVLATFLWIDSFGYNIIVGAAPTKEEILGNIPYWDIGNVVRQISNENTHTPKVKKIADLTARDYQRWIQIDSVQFIEKELGRSWADKDSLHTYRHIEDHSGNTLRIYTSGYATYGDTQIPSGSGSIDGIIYHSKEGLILRPNSSTRAKFTNPRF